jgi:hypothetical protein
VACASRPRDPALLGQVTLAELPYPSHRRLQAGLVEQVVQDLAVGVPDHAAPRGSREEGHVVPPEITAFRRDDSWEVGAVCGLDPEAVEEAVTVERVAQELRVEALVPEQAVDVRGADDDADPVLGEPG